MKNYNTSSIDNQFLKNVLETFLNTNETKKRFQNYFIDGNTLFFRTTDNRLHIPKMIEHIIATKIKHKDESTLIIGNSSVLAHVDKKASHKLNTTQTNVQRHLSQLVPMLPMNVFEQASLDVNQLRFVEQAKEETIQVRQDNPGWIKWNNYQYYNTRGKKEPKRYIKVDRHYTGASLFQIGTECFLFDIDRREVEYGIFNAFLVNLPKPVRTIKQAYESLKPMEVKQAEKKGRNVLRQGEWFFIPVNARVNSTLNKIKKQTITKDNPYLDRIELRAGQNRPNHADGMELKDGKRMQRSWNNRQTNVKADELYVTGTVIHSGREHKELKLNGWYKPVPNTAQKSFTITGDVD